MITLADVPVSEERGMSSRGYLDSWYIDLAWYIVAINIPTHRHINSSVSKDGKLKQKISGLSFSTDNWWPHAITDN